MTIELSSEFQGVTSTAVEAAFLVQNFYIPPATAQIGGLSFPASLILSDADWDFLASALEAPPRIIPLLGGLLTEPSILDR